VSRPKGFEEGQDQLPRGVRPLPSQKFQPNIQRLTWVASPEEGHSAWLHNGNVARRSGGGQAELFDFASPTYHQVKSHHCRGLLHHPADQPCDGKVDTRVAQ